MCFLALACGSDYRKVSKLPAFCYVGPIRRCARPASTTVPEICQDDKELLAAAFDLSFFISIGLVFLLALVDAYLRSTLKDRCLKSWEGFHITVERANGKVIWGVIQVEPTGMELSDLDTVQDEKHIESTFLIYSADPGRFRPSTATLKNCRSGEAQRGRDVEGRSIPGRCGVWAVRPAIS